MDAMNPGARGEFIVLEKDFMKRLCVVEITITEPGYIEGEGDYIDPKKVVWFLDYMECEGDIGGDVADISEPGTAGEFRVFANTSKRLVVEIMGKRVIWFLDYPNVLQSRKVEGEVAESK